jgi:hypothetical protein
VRTSIACGDLSSNIKSEVFVDDEIFYDILWDLVVKLVWFFPPCVMGQLSHLLTPCPYYAARVSAYGTVFVWIVFKENICKYDDNISRCI